MSTTNPDKQIVSGNQPFERAGALEKYLEQAKAQIGKALPGHMKPDRMLRIALTEWSKSAGLRNCTGLSIMSSIVVASQLGLEPGIAGQGYLIPYGSTCQFVPGWQGLVGLLNNTGRATAWTGAVYEGDEFSYSIGSRPHIDHKPGDNYGDQDKITHFYACGKVNGAEIPVIECWTRARVEKHRDKYNKVGKKHYSYAHPEMYGRKVVLLQVLKYMPRSIEVNNALEVSDANMSNRFARMEGDIVMIDDAPPVSFGEEPKIEEGKPNPEPKVSADKATPAPESTTAEDKPAAPAEAGKVETPTLNDRQKAEKGLASLQKMGGISDEELRAYCVSKSLIREDQAFSSLALPRLQQLVENWGATVQDEIVQRRSATP